VKRPRLRRWLRRIAIGLLAVLAALTAASLAYNAATGGESKPATALYAGPFVRVGDTLVAYRRWGSRGAPIVLLGGFVEPSWVWHAVGPLLARTHRVYALDLPPFGYTQRTGRYRLTDWSELVRGFDERLRISRPLVVGHSLGAAVAVGDALEHPRSVRGVVLLDGDGLAAGGPPHWLASLLVDPFFTSIFRIATGSDWIVRRALSAAYGKHAPKQTAATLDEWERPFRVAGTADAFRTMLSYGIQGYRLADLRRVRVPRLVVWGADDTVDDVSAGRTSAAALHARFVLVPGAGHLSMLANPRAVARAIAGAR
jgi:pimeloyl-ACP methyl ester carboxylesterase